MNELKECTEKMFEDIKHFDEEGNEYWLARELQTALDYKEWRKFENVIYKAKIACNNSNIDINEQFVGIDKLSINVNGGKRIINDYKLSRYACYLIAQNGDSRKEVINIVKELNRKEGMTIILITHHTDEVVDADRIVLMKDGKIIGDDIPKKIFADYELLKKAKMDIPPVVELGMRLEKQQIGLEGPVLQEQEMIEKIVKLYRSKCGGKKDAAR